MEFDTNYIKALMTIRDQANILSDDALWEVSNDLIQTYCTTRIVSTTLVTSLLTRIIGRA